MALDGSVAERAANGESIAARDQAVWPRIQWAGALLTLSLLGATLLGSMARFLWLGDLAVHFPVQYAGLALIALVLFLVARRPAWAALALAVAAANVMNAAPAMSSRPPPALKVPSDPVRVRVASINVLYSNREYQRVAEFIHRERPDAVVLVEMNAAWRGGLAAVEREYPYRYQTVGTSGRGVDLWSRLPFKDVGVLPIESRQEPAIQATLLAQGRPMRLFAVHTTWPMAPASEHRRNKQLALLAPLTRATAVPLVVVGDFNLTPFSPYFRQLLRDGHLRSAAEGFGWQPTWPSFLPPAGIQIDHAFVSPAVSVQGFHRGMYDGSDHRPIVVDVML